MERSPESSIESSEGKLQEITSEIESLELERSMLMRVLNAHTIPDVVQKVDDIDKKLMGLKIELEYHKGETE